MSNPIPVFVTDDVHQTALEAARKGTSETVENNTSLGLIFVTEADHAKALAAAREVGIDDKVKSIVPSVTIPVTVTLTDDDHAKAFAAARKVGLNKGPVQ